MGHVQLLIWVIPSSAQGSLLKVKSPHLLDQRTLFFSLSLFSFLLSGLYTCLSTYRRPQEYHHYSWRSHCRFGSQSSFLCATSSSFCPSVTNLLGSEPPFPFWCQIKSGYFGPAKMFGPICKMAPIFCINVFSAHDFHMLHSVSQLLLGGSVKTCQFCLPKDESEVCYLSKASWWIMAEFFIRLSTCYGLLCFPWINTRMYFLPFLWSWMWVHVFCLS